MENKWEQIDSTTERLKVPNGWLVHRTVDLYAHYGTCGIIYRTGDLSQRKVTTISTSMVFVIDQLHQWKLEESPEEPKKTAYGTFDEFDEE